MIVLPWEKDRAQAVAGAMRELVTRGVTGGDILPALIAPEALPAGVDDQARLAAYGMLAGLNVIEPWFTIDSFANNWATFGGDTFQVCKDPFGWISWRGLIGRTSGTASNGELICTVPPPYRPSRFLGFPCITDSGLIHIGLFPDGQMTWRTTGGFTGGYTFVYAHNIGRYDQRP